MIDGKRVLGLIPARGGSKGLPRKNILEVGGKPLIAWTIDAACKSRFIDRLVLSSEDAEIAEVARRYGCDVPFVRPADLATDSVSAIEVALHAIRELPDFDYLVLLQPTSPLRTAEDIDGCIERAIRYGVGSCVSVVEVEANPYWMFRDNAEGGLVPLLGDWDMATKRRQDLPPVYCLNGAVYVNSTSWLLGKRAFVASGTVGFPMPATRSLDIDTASDLAELKEFLERKSNAN